MSEKRKDSKGRVLKDGESERKDGRYQYRFQDNSGKRHSVYASTLNELREKELQIQKDLLDNIDYAGGQITVVELLERYEAQKRKLRKSTKEVHGCLIKLISKYDFGRRSISSVKRSDVIAFVQALSDDGYKYGSVKNVLAFLKPAFNSAVEDDILRKNPCRFKLSDVIEDNTQPKEPLSASNQVKLLDFIKGDACYKKHYDSTLILLKSGIRISELCGLTYADVDIPNRRLKINKQLYRRGGKLCVEQPKTKSSTRSIPITDEDLLQALKRAVATRKKSTRDFIIDGYGGFLFTSRNGHPRTGQDYSRIFNHIVDAYNRKHPDKLPHVSPHVFRHTCSTELFEEGLDCKSLAYFMGHSKADTTLNVYTHANEDSTREALLRLTGTEI